jgi:hypothetical protein
MSFLEQAIRKLANPDVPPTGRAIKQGKRWPIQQNLGPIGVDPETYENAKRTLGKAAIPAAITITTVFGSGRGERSALAEPQPSDTPRAPTPAIEFRSPISTPTPIKEVLPSPLEKTRVFFETPTARPTPVSIEPVPGLDLNDILDAKKQNRQEQRVKAGAFEFVGEFPSEEKTRLQKELLSIAAALTKILGERPYPGTIRVYYDEKNEFGPEAGAWDPSENMPAGGLLISWNGPNTEAQRIFFLGHEMGHLYGLPVLGDCRFLGVEQFDTDERNANNAGALAQYAITGVRNPWYLVNYAYDRDSTFFKNFLGEYRNTKTSSTAGKSEWTAIAEKVSPGFKSWLGRMEQAYLDYDVKVGEEVKVVIPKEGETPRQSTPIPTYSPELESILRKRPIVP